MLALINAGGDHRVASLARAVKLPRSTAFRILCTLVEEGYVWRDPATDIYQPTALVLALSDGFDATARLVQAAQPVVTELGKQLIWPVMLATLSGASVLLRQTTDAASPLAVVRRAAGHRVPLLEHASGLVLLAFGDKQQTGMAMDLLYREDAAENATLSRAELIRRVAEIRSVGFACCHRPGSPSERSSLAVPVQAGVDTVAALDVGFARSAVTQEVIMSRFLPVLRKAAHCIVERLKPVQPPSATKVSAYAAPDRTEA